MSVAARAIVSPLTPHEQLNAVLADAGVSRTVYSFVMPETEAALNEVLDKNREALHAMYREAWTQKQDTMHEEFFSAWKMWSSPVVTFDAQEFPFFYTTAGASEALREAVHDYGARARVEGFMPAIHVFAAEYEGFSAYAQAAGIPVVVHDRSCWRDRLSKIGPRDQFYLSHPSAIDGNIWQDYDAFVSALHRVQPSAEMMVDLTYVGCVARAFRVNLSSPNIRAVFFSLSKPMGVYYHRIGGMLSRRAYPGLFGNKWFKNLLSLKLGTLMLRKYGVHELPTRYAACGQRIAIQKTVQKLKLNLEPSDVVLLATAKPSAQMNDLECYLQRSPGTLLRLCLTPTIANIIDPSLNPHVKARTHEGVTKKGEG